jgi:hypothetical protein
VIDGSTLTPTAVADLRARLSNNAPWIVEHVDEVSGDAVAPTRRLLDAAAEMAAPPVAPGEIEVRSTVTMTSAIK